MKYLSKDPEVIAKVNHSKRPRTADEVSSREAEAWERTLEKIRPLVTFINCMGGCGGTFPIYTERARKYSICDKCATRLCAVQFPDFRVVR